MLLVLLSARSASKHSMHAHGIWSLCLQRWSPLRPAQGEVPAAPAGDAGKALLRGTALQQMTLSRCNCPRGSAAGFRAEARGAGSVRSRDAGSRSNLTDFAVDGRLRA